MNALAPSTSSLWSNMFGLGGFIKMLADPEMQSHAHQMMEAIIESALISRRLEEKLSIVEKKLEILMKAYDNADRRTGIEHRGPAIQDVDAGGFGNRPAEDAGKHGASASRAL